MDDRGVVAEFGDLDDVIETNLLLGDDGLDHADLNTVIDNPTVERLAVHIGERLSSLSLNWTRVELWETSRGAAIVER
jgi:6-pyruvoyl-tetrahydropterin synthase